MKYAIAVILLLTCVLCTLAKHEDKTIVDRGSMVFIESSTEALGSLIAAELLKQKLPLIIVTDQAKADYLLTGVASVSGHTGKGNGGLLAPVRGHDQYSGSITMVNVKTSAVVWASDSDNGKLQQAAERIVKQMKKDLF